MCIDRRVFFLREPTEQTTKEVKNCAQARKEEERACCVCGHCTCTCATYLNVCSRPPFSPSPPRSRFKDLLKGMVYTTITQAHATTPHAHASPRLPFPRRARVWVEALLPRKNPNPNPTQPNSQRILLAKIGVGHTLCSGESLSVCPKVQVTTSPRGRPQNDDGHAFHPTRAPPLVHPGWARSRWWPISGCSVPPPPPSPLPFTIDLTHSPVPNSDISALRRAWQNAN